ncbi:MAG: alpha/beta hydrolase [Paracoccaceae bacterium]
MQGVFRVVMTVLVLLVLALVLLFFLAPREQVDLRASFDPAKFGEGVQVYFESVESAFDDIVPGVEKRVIWQDGFKEQRSPVSILYVHGFSATSEEIRPVPDKLAEALGANLVYTRLTGHGRPGDAMGEATVNDWMQDMAEGLAAARAVGEKVIVLSTSTGGTLSAAAAMDPALSQDVAAMIFVSPNFGVNDKNAHMLTYPGAEWLLPLAIGKTRGFEPTTEAEGIYWTERYPTVAVLPMAALVKAVVEMPLEQATTPALFWFSPLDQVVRSDITQQVADRWGGPTEVQLVDVTDGMDASAHVIAGDILSPAGTGPAVAGMLSWLRGQGF